MPKTYQAKVAKINETEWRLFIRSNYYFIPAGCEQIEGAFNASRKTFEAGSRKFKVAQDYSAQELN